MLSNDFRMWKISRIVKEANEIKQIEQVFQNNVKDLKQIYLTLISNSTYPNLTWLDFVNYAKSCDIIDENMPMSTVDRLFIATNVELTD